MIVDDTRRGRRLQRRPPRRPTCAPSWWCPIWVGEHPLGRHQPRGDPPATPSTRTTPGWSRPSRTRPGPRCARRRSTSGWRRPTWAPRRRSPRRSRRRTPTPPATPARWWNGRWPSGETLGMDDDELRTLRFGAIFHDIGKIAVPEAILNKRGPARRAEERARDRAAHDRRRADPLHGRLPRARAAAGPPRARALGRHAATPTARGRGHPARLADHPRLRRLRRDDQRPPVSGRHVGRRRPGRAARRRRHAVRRARRGRAAPGARGGRPLRRR